MNDSLLQKAEECAKLIDGAKRIAVLTGAGISTSAGIPDFRGPQGLYVTKRYDPETVFDIDYFYRDPKPFFDFAKDFITLETTLEPTFTHYFFARLEQSGHLEGVITQNIDSLHHRAGSKDVFELHGSFLRSHCLDCHKEFDYEDVKIKLKTQLIPQCSCAGVIKPDVVFFGENIKFLNEALQLAEESDLFFVVGTSCAVHPAAMVPTAARGKIVIVNKGDVHLNLKNIVLEVQDDIDRFFKKVADCSNFKI